MVDGSQFLVSCLFSKSLGFASEKNWRVGFTIAEDGSDDNNTGLFLLAFQEWQVDGSTYGDCDDPKHPTPSLGLGEETTSHGANNRA